MSERGAEWYKREPRAFLEGVRRMTEREIAVYAVVLDLIYDGGHQTLDDPKHIASYFSDLGVAAVRRAIDLLCAAGKLARDGEYLTNKRARNEGKTRRELSETRRAVGRLGGVSSSKKRAVSSQNNNLPEASASARAKQVSSLEGDGEGDKKEEPSGSSKSPVKPARKGTPVFGFQPDIEWAVSQGLDRRKAELSSERFIDFWRGKPGRDGLKSDWPATWRNWVRKDLTDVAAKPDFIAQQKARYF